MSFLYTRNILYNINFMYNVTYKIYNCILKNDEGICNIHMWTEQQNPTIEIFLLVHNTMIIYINYVLIINYVLFINYVLIIHYAHGELKDPSQWSYKLQSKRDLAIITAKSASNWMRQFLRFSVLASTLTLRSMSIPRTSIRFCDILM